MQLGGDAVVAVALKVLDFLLALHNQAHGNALHAACTQGGLDFGPQDGTNLIAHQPVQHTASLLGIH